MSVKTRKENIIDTIDDLCSDFLYYNRKEDESLSYEDIEQAVKSGEITIDEMVAEFRKHLENTLIKEEDTKKEEVEKAKRMLTYEEAVSLIKEGPEVHTFRNGAGMLFGFDYSREGLLKKMKECENTLELTGETARSMHHGIALEDETGYLFIETDDDKLNQFRDKE